MNHFKILFAKTENRGQIKDNFCHIDERSETILLFLDIKNLFVTHKLFNQASLLLKFV